MAYGFNDGHIAVGTVHSVKHVPTHQSSITTVPSGTDCQICHELRRSHLLHWEIPWIKKFELLPISWTEKSFTY